MLRFLEDVSNHTDDSLTESDESNSSTPWGPAIGAAITVQLTTLSGIIIIATSLMYRRYNAKSEDSKQFTNLVWTLQYLVVPSFAVGALLATAVFLIIPEAFHLLQGEEAHSEEEHRLRRKMAVIMIRSLVEGNETAYEQHTEESTSGSVNSENQVAWKFGAAFLAGFIFPILLGLIFPEPEVLQAQLDAEDVHEDETKKLTKEEQGITLDMTNAEDGQEANTDDVVNISSNEEPISEDGKATMGSNGTKDMTTTTSGNDRKSSPIVSATEIPSIVKTKNIPLAGSILIGDFFHNLADGFFIGSAFLLCSKSIGWALVASTIYHEIAQEIADYVLLTSHCGLTIIEALGLNFLSGCSVMVGVIIILSVDLDGPAIGTILAVSAGVYVYIAVAECMPRVQAVLRKGNMDHSRKVRYTMIFFLFFVLGAVPIGLVLLNHGHCEVH
jgi:zinc transporter ZupT